MNFNNLIEDVENEYLDNIIIPTDSNKNIFILEFYKYINFVDRNLMSSIAHEEYLIHFEKEQIIPYINNKYYNITISNSRYVKYWLSPFNEDFSFNEKFIEEGTVFADGNGKEKTQKLLEVLSENPHILDVLNYETVGTNKGDWFIPSVAELSYFISNQFLLLRSIHKLNWLTFFEDMYAYSSTHSIYKILFITSNYITLDDKPDIVEVYMYNMNNNKFNLFPLNDIGMKNELKYKTLLFCEVDV